MTAIEIAKELTELAIKEKIEAYSVKIKKRYYSELDRFVQSKKDD